MAYEPATSSTIENHAELMRACAPLYPSFALESVASLSLFVFFSYLAVLISSKQQLNNPAKSMCKFVCWNLSEWASDTAVVLGRWSDCDTMTLAERFRFCRRLNATICRFSATCALISVTRWLHINNINGFRYLGYAITCPLMQGELILLIAPVVPCFRELTVFTAVLTATMLVSGAYVSGQMEGPLWTTDMEDILLEGNLSNLTRKGWQVVPSVFVLFFLLFVQIPILAIIYFCNGGGSKGVLPYGYPTLLLITSLTWVGFPIWWFLSYEGASVITDTKLNGFGFVTLNAASKGLYTMQMIGMVKYFKKHFAPQQQQPQQPAPNRQPSGPMALPGDDQEDAPAPARRSGPRAKTNVSLDWFIKGMNNFDENQGASGQNAAKDAEPEKPSNDAIKEKIVYDCSKFEVTDLVEELHRRLGISGPVGELSCFDAKKAPTEQNAFESAVDKEIAAACARFADIDCDSD